MKKKELFIDISFIFANNKTGIGAYILTLYNALNFYNIKYKEVEIKLPNWLRYKYLWYIVIWLNTAFYIKTLINKPTAIISPSFIMPYFKRQKTNYITVIHDLDHLKSGRLDKYFAFIINLSTNITIKKADTIVTVSETIKNELIQTFNIDQHRIKVVYNSLGEHFINSENNSEILNKYNIQKQKYILSVATLNRRKNIPELIKAFESITDKYPDIKLVLVGGMGNEKRELLTKHPNVIFTGYIPDENLPSLYKNALLYVFPSLYEGFGIPLIEAQYSNCPVLCSDIPVFQEVAGNGAEFCTPDSNGIAAKLEYLINNEQRRLELISLGQENVKRFSIEKIARQLSDVLEN